MDDLVELNLRRGASVAADATDFKSVAQSLLRVVFELPAESASAETTEILNHLKAHASALASGGHAQEQRIAAAACVKTCDQFLRRLWGDFTTREKELRDVVALLRDAAARMLGDSSEFHAKLNSSTDRLKTMTRLDDIRELKRQLSTEVSSIERAVEEKQKRDQEIISTLSQRVEVLQADLQKAEEEASLDGLTQIPNRRSFDRKLPRMVAAARSSNAPLTLAMLDIDHFKAVNDTHGHTVGDRVLLCTAEWLRAAVRHTDFVARYGGEEFAVILHDADLAQAEERFQQVIRDIASRNYEYDLNGEARSVRFTVSCGISQLSGNDTERQLIERADRALYEAKRKGRNRVFVRKASLFERIL